VTTPTRRQQRAAGNAKPRRRRGEGQWALGYREPLNKNEQSKKDDNPLNVRARIENIYAHGGFESIDPGDLRGRFRWYGLYTQRKPGIDGGRTAPLEPEDLDDRYFMMRVRVDGGALTTSQLALLGEISQTHARDTADITDRQNIQYHWIQIEDMPTIWQKLEAAGLTTMEACGDSPRVILNSPVAGIADDEVVASHVGIDIARSQVRRILLAEGVRWRRPRSWATSPDPEFVPKERGSWTTTRTRRRRPR
jgi:sulfite reductase (ferredoxin)